MYVAALCMGVAAVTASIVPAAQAEMVSTQQLLNHDSRAQQEAQARAFLRRDDVRRQMVALGVDPAMADRRVAALTDSELQQLSKTISTAPAAGDATIFILFGVIFLVLILLELLGVTHIFRRF
jgi:hypothetical protein